MSALTKKIVVALSAAVLSYAAIGYVLGKSSDDQTYRSLGVYSEVLAHVQHDYVDEPDVKKVTTGALHGLLESLDPQSSYLSPLEYQDYKRKADSGGEAQAGLALSKRYGYIIVVAAMPDSPALKAGLHGGDVLESVAGFTTSEMSIGQAQVLLTGVPGSVVKLSVIHRGKVESADMDLTLARVPAPRLLENRIQGDIAYLRVPAFEPGMAKQIREKLVEMDHQGARKLILDLRDCALGDVEEGVATARLFLPSGTITTLKGQTAEPQVSSADPSKVAWKMPMTVLISSGTAGPSEVLAAAIADNQRGETIGDRTFGAASSQKIIQLDDGSALILTVANYFTPSGKSIPAEGVTPHVATTSADQLTEDEEGGTSAPPPGQVASPDDPVLKKAIEILQGTAAHPKAA